MSKGLSYFLGIVTGILLTLGFFAVKNYMAKQGSVEGATTEKQAKLPDGVTMFDETVPFTGANNFKVMQVLFENAALALSEENMGLSFVHYTDPVVLILSDQKNTFYDDQIVKAPKDCKVMQVGTYQYETQLGWKTVPIIRFVKEQ